MNEEKVKTIAPRSGKEVLETMITQFGLPAVGALVTSYPEFLPAWILVSGYYGSYFAIYQNRINDFAIFIRDNRDKFVKEIVDSEMFRDGFVVTFEHYIKQRLEKKRRIIQRIFLGFTSSVDQSYFSLERLCSVADLISMESVEYLSFICKEIIPKRKERLMKTRNSLTVDEDNKNRFMDQARTQEPLSRDVDNWINDHFDPNTKSVSEHWGYKGKNQKLLEAIYDAKSVEVKKWEKARSELLSLGILELVDLGSGQIGGGPNISYALSNFGLEFLDYIQNLNLK